MCLLSTGYQKFARNSKFTELNESKIIFLDGDKGTVINLPKFVSAVILNFLLTSAQNNKLIINSELYHTVKKTGKSAILFKSCWPPFVYAFNILLLSLTFNNISQFLNTKKVEPVSSKMSVSLYLPLLLFCSWVHEKWTKSCSVASNCSIWSSPSSWLLS